MAESGIVTAIIIGNFDIASSTTCIEFSQKSLKSKSYTVNYQYMFTIFKYFQSINQSINQLGCGQRGQNYAGFALDFPTRLKVY